MFGKKKKQDEKIASKDAEVMSDIMKFMQDYTIIEMIGILEIVKMTIFKLQSRHADKAMDELIKDGRSE